MIKEKMSISEKFVLTPKEAAAYIGISENRIRTLCSEGELPALKSGQNWKIPKTLLEEWIIEKYHSGNIAI